MLSKPKNGWATITIGTWSDRCSYLEDVPVILLKGFVASCITHRPAAMKLDAEGHEYIIVVDWTATHIITDEGQDLGEFKLVTQNIDRDILATKLISSIRENIDDWTLFTAAAQTSDDIKNRKLELTELCDQLEQAIPGDDLKQVWPPLNAETGTSTVSAVEIEDATSSEFATVSTLQDVSYAASTGLRYHSSEDNLIRCPKCGQSYYCKGISETTAMYFPPIYKDGVNINPDRNTRRTHYHCMNCGHDWVITY